MATSSSSIPSPHFFLQVEQMRPSQDFEPRYDGQGHWKPPNPLGSNELIQEEAASWYEFDNWHARAVGALDDEKYDYKTFSFYSNEGRIWMWEGDATSSRIGDGVSNRRIRPRVTGRQRHANRSSSDESEDSAHTDDWAQLSFLWPIPQDPLHRSRITRRGNSRQVRLQQRNSIGLYQLLPEPYRAASDQRHGAQGHGGILGDLPILIALLALSVLPSEVGGALVNCLRRTYRPHQYNIGRGWAQPQRGIVVRTLCDTDRDSDDLAIQRVEAYEMGRFGTFAA
ncbi:uncharacterized protein LTR77_011065 [Saxophila tyrrhenica]|uniref:Uncharacterized protein n=1 Tax=Saxophila tyrrhenica TaxID=1690608 RepID=A0AAV9NU22_9PEZI|nr:hypothetical protein LTR77_011065 [Saxophila tyrrhenica]